MSFTSRAYSLVNFSDEGRGFFTTFQNIDVKNPGGQPKMRIGSFSAIFWGAMIYFRHSSGLIFCMISNPGKRLLVVPAA